MDRMKCIVESSVVDNTFHSVLDRRIHCGPDKRVARRMRNAMDNSFISGQPFVLIKKQPFVLDTMQPSVLDNSLDNGFPIDCPRTKGCLVTSASLYIHRAGRYKPRALMGGIPDRRVTVPTAAHSTTAAAGRWEVAVGCHGG